MADELALQGVPQAILPPHLEHSHPTTQVRHLSSCTESWNLEGLVYRFAHRLPRCGAPPGDARLRDIIQHRFYRDRH